MIRVATLEDAKEILDIYAYYVKDTAITFEYEAPSLLMFVSRMEHTLKKYPYLVAVEQGRIVGYAYAGEFHGRQAYDWAVETSIYVRSDQRHHGTGKQLYQALEMWLTRMHIINLNACIAYPRTDDIHLNTDSVDFHEHLGYRWVGRFHKCGYKLHTWYDMVWMEKCLRDHPVVPEPVVWFEQIRGLYE